MRNDNALWLSIAVIAVVVAIFIFSVAMFGNCYSEHREQGFTVWTSIMSCSG